WAEDLNSIVIIIGLTGIGALSLTLNQFRSVKLHRRQAMTDALTDLMNRRALFERFTAGALPEGSAVVMFDLDHFKSVNDLLGHAVGDQVLKMFAGLLRAGARPGDAAARLGGEEFCMVLEASPHRSAAAVAETIRAAFEATAMSPCDGTVNTTVSAGVAISGVGGEPFEDLLRRADDALYRAKSAGRNRVHAPGPRLVA
ncbi:MAG TPA: GGDEF domain-containing protein, partial [Devosia sp.]|nr:GGDEF domain-containing protein [Devosia sp.]